MRIISLTSHDPGSQKTLEKSSERSSDFLPLVAAEYPQNKPSPGQALNEVTEYETHSSNGDSTTLPIPVQTPTNHTTTPRWRNINMDDYMPTCRLYNKSSSHYTSFLNNQSSVRHGNKSNQYDAKLSTLGTQLIHNDGGYHDAFHSEENMLNDSDQVYSTNESCCTMILAVKESHATVKEIIITAPPRTSFTSPVKHVAIFISMARKNLLQRCDSFIRDRPELDAIFNDNNDREASAERSIHYEDSWKPLLNALDPIQDFPPSLPQGDISEIRTVQYTIQEPVYFTNPDTGVSTLDLDSEKPSWNADRIANIPTITSSSTWSTDHGILPIALGSIPRTNKRQLKIELNQSVIAKYIVVKFSSVSKYKANIDIESCIVRGSHKYGAAFEYI